MEKKYILISILLLSLFLTSCAGNIVIEDATTFSEGLAAVKVNGKYGIIDKNGKEILPPIYDEEIKYLTRDKLLVRLNGKMTIFNKNEEKLIEKFYDELV